MSKGSLQRPHDRERYAANYERIFGKKKITKEKNVWCSCDRVNTKSEACEFCKRNPAASIVQSRFFCPERGEPLDG